MTDSSFATIPSGSHNTATRSAIKKQIVMALFDLDEFEDNGDFYYYSGDGISLCLLLEGIGPFAHVKGVELKLSRHSGEYTRRSVMVKDGQISISQLKKKLAELKALQVIETEKRNQRKQVNSERLARSLLLRATAEERGIDLRKWDVLSNGLRLQHGVIGPRVFTIEQALRVEQLLNEFEQENGHE